MRQLKTDGKSNEIPELLALLDIKGPLVTIDTIGTQADIAHTTIDKGADFLLAIKVLCISALLKIIIQILRFSLRYF
ncbi:MAG TPA: hypothetical protein DCY70_03395 [Shewanella sp.]|nr:hypothetical protein [Shewanella sp.]